MWSEAHDICREEHEFQHTALVSLNIW